MWGGPPAAEHGKDQRNGGELEEQEEPESCSLSGSCNLTFSELCGNSTGQRIFKLLQNDQIAQTVKIIHIRGHTPTT